MRLFSQIKRLLYHLTTKVLFGASGEIRTPNSWFRRPELYPVELQTHDLML